MLLNKQLQMSYVSSTYLIIETYKYQSQNSINKNRNKKLSTETWKTTFKYWY